MVTRPIIAITMGDPAGIGPEVVAKALAQDEVWEVCRPLVVGDADTLSRAAALVDPASTGLTLHAITYVERARFERATPDVFDLGAVDVDVAPGRVSAAAGQAAVACIKQATALALSGQVVGFVTGPINKAALQAAGCPYIGHTELLAALTGAERVTTMLATPGLRVVHVTRHLPLAKVAAQITRQRVLQTLRLTDAGLREMGVPRPQVAVTCPGGQCQGAALNPHGGDEGLLGREEIEEIGSAVAAARTEGIAAHGPIPADSFLSRHSGRV